MEIFFKSFDKEIHDTRPTKYTNLFFIYLYYNITLSVAALSVPTVPLSGNETVVIQHDTKIVTLCTADVVQKNQTVQM
jgi:hypothetical protein